MERDAEKTMLKYGRSRRSRIPRSAVFDEIQLHQQCTEYFHNEYVYVVIARTQWTCESRCSAVMVTLHISKSRYLITFVGVPTVHAVRIYREN